MGAVPYVSIADLEESARRQAIAFLLENHTVITAAGPDGYLLAGDDALLILRGTGARLIPYRDIREVRTQVGDLCAITLMLPDSVLQVHVWRDRGGMLLIAYLRGRMEGSP